MGWSLVRRKRRVCEEDFFFVHCMNVYTYIAIDRLDISGQHHHILDFEFRMQLSYLRTRRDTYLAGYKYTFSMSSLEWNCNISTQGNTSMQLNVVEY